MWRRSWLSREVLLFGLFFVSVGMCTVCSWAGALGFAPAARLVLPCAVAGVVFGIAGTLASAYIYLVHARPAWDMVHTPLDFLLSAALMGSVIPAGAWPALRLSELAGHFGLHLPVHTVDIGAIPTLLLALCWAANQVVRTLRLRGSASFEMRASYNLLRGDDLWWRLALALMAALVTPLFFAAPLPLLAVATALAAVLLGRYLFFVSVVPLSMGLTFHNRRAAHGVREVHP